MYTLTGIDVITEVESSYPMLETFGISGIGLSLGEGMPHFAIRFSDTSYGVSYWDNKVTVVCTEMRGPIDYVEVIDGESDDPITFKELPYGGSVDAVLDYAQKSGKVPVGTKLLRIAALFMDETGREYEIYLPDEQVTAYNEVKS